MLSNYEYLLAIIPWGLLVILAQIKLLRAKDLSRKAFWIHTLLIYVVPVVWALVVLALLSKPKPPRKPERRPIHPNPTDYSQYNAADMI